VRDVPEMMDVLEIQEMMETLDMPDVVDNTTIFSVFYYRTAKMEVKI
jgi:pseudouridine-5'-phosphate glycosidase